MAKVVTDVENKLVEVELGGFIKADEAARVASELKNTLRQFGPKQAVLLIDLAGFAPMGNDVLPVLRGLGRDSIGFFRKAAVVQEFSIQVHGRKVVEPPPGFKLPAYPTREAALEYLLAEEEEDPAA